jgi:hypothetical protein
MVGAGGVGVGQTVCSAENGKGTTEYIERPEKFVAAEKW